MRREICKWNWKLVKNPKPRWCWPVGYLQDVEKFNRGPQNTNPSNGREETPGCPNHNPPQIVQCHSQTIFQQCIKSYLRISNDMISLQLDWEFDSKLRREGCHWRQCSRCQDNTPCLRTNLRENLGMKETINLDIHLLQWTESCSSNYKKNKKSLKLLPLVLFHSESVNRQKA